MYTHKTLELIKYSSCAQFQFHNVKGGVCVLSASRNSGSSFYVEAVNSEIRVSQAVQPCFGGIVMSRKYHNII
jgi:hypothetical protein